MARDPQTYHAVMSSPLLSDPMRQIYYVLWQHEAGLTKGEIERACIDLGIPRAPWDKEVSVLAKMGITKRGNKRHCTAKNKEDVVWLLTDSATPSKAKANKPSAKVYEKGVAQLEMLIAQHDSRGDGLVTPELRKLHEWVRDKIK